jgi:hypothetical protein
MVNADGSWNASVVMARAAYAATGAWVLRLAATS